MRGIEPPSRAWEARVLPLNHIRAGGHSSSGVAASRPRRADGRTPCSTLRRDDPVRPFDPGRDPAGSDRDRSLRRGRTPALVGGPARRPDLPHVPQRPVPVHRREEGHARTHGTGRGGGRYPVHPASGRVRPGLHPGAGPPPRRPGGPARGQVLPGTPGPAHPFHGRLRRSGLGRLPDPRAVERGEPAHHHLPGHEDRTDLLLPVDLLGRAPVRVHRPGQQVPGPAWTHAQPVLRGVRPGAGAPPLTSPFGPLVLIGPAQGTAEDLAATQDELRTRGLAYRVERVDGPDGAAGVAGEALRRGERFLVAVGGDPTINGVVNGIIDEGGVAAAEAVLGVVAGRAPCDLIRSFGLPPEPDRACAHLEGDRVFAIDAAAVHVPSRGGRRYFVNMAEVGLGGAVSAAASRLAAGLRRVRRFAGIWVAVATGRTRARLL